MLVRIELGENLEAIATGRNLREIVFDLVTWAETNGRVDDLLKGAQRQNPGNRDLVEFMQTWQPDQLPASDSASSDSAVKEPPDPASVAVPIDLTSDPLVIGWEDLSQAVAQDLLPELPQHSSQPDPQASLAADVIEEDAGEPAASSSPELSVADNPILKKVVSRALFLFLIVALVAGVVGILFLATTNRTMTNPKDGAVYVYVPAGPFVMGASDEDQLADDYEKPQQPDLYLDAFWIMQTEVTNAQYAKCVTEGACSEPSGTLWNSQDYAQHPVTGVDWYQANAYAQWVGGRLPTEAEWEKACRGTDGRTFPWGNAPTTGELVNFVSNVGGTTPVGSYPKGASPYGVLDMAGNVWEWTRTTYSAYPYDPTDGREATTGDADRTLRGGSWYNDATNVRCVYRFGFNPYDGFDNFGFRVVAPGLGS